MCRGLLALIHWIKVCTIGRKVGLPSVLILIVPGFARPEEVSYLEFMRTLALLTWLLMTKHTLDTLAFRQIDWVANLEKRVFEDGARRRRL